MVNYRFLYFYIVFILAINLFVGYYDASMATEIDPEISQESWFSSAWDAISFLFTTAFFGVFSPSIPIAISLILWLPASILAIIGIYEIVVLLIP